MALIPINFDEGKLVDLPMTAATYTKGQMLVCTSGYYVTAADAGTVEVTAVCMEGIVIATTGDTARCITTRGVKFLADTDNAPAQTDVGTHCALASGTKLDPDDASTETLFFIESVIMPLANKQVIGYFNHENPNES